MERLPGSDAVSLSMDTATVYAHAFGTNLQFEDDEFNFVKTRAEHGTKRALDRCKTHFEVPEP